MDEDQLAETTLVPSRRVLRRCTVEDAEAATEMFEICMGADVFARREYINEHATDLDPDVIDASPIRRTGPDLVSGTGGEATLNP